MKGKLILEDGSVFRGEIFGDSTAAGEVVFNTGMTGYQEILTDPSYCRQIVTLTYPLIGNYGTAKIFSQSRKSFVSGLVIGEICEIPSNFTLEKTFADYLRDNKIPCLYNVDTRAVTRKIRAAGTMKGVIAADSTPQNVIAEMLAAPVLKDVVAQVTIDAPYTLDAENSAAPIIHAILKKIDAEKNRTGAEVLREIVGGGLSVSRYATRSELREIIENLTDEQIAAARNFLGLSKNVPFVVAMDFGVKQHILDSLHNLGCKITVVPASTPAENILALNPDGIFLSNGPGDPKDLPEVVAEIKKLIGVKPIFGICLGHQLLALALGADTYKLKFGHRGSNQPVKNLKTGRVYITAQNHGYAVDEKSLAGLPVEVTYISANDGTVEGLRHKSLPIFSVQYHPEASPGPRDNMYLFDEFFKLMEVN